MSSQPPVRSEGVNNPDNVTGTKKYFLRSRAHGDEESLHEQSSTRSPSPSPDSRDDRIMELEESIHQLKAKKRQGTKTEWLQSRVEHRSSSLVILLESSLAPRDESYSSGRASLLESSHSPRVEPCSSRQVILLETSFAP